MTATVHMTIKITGPGCAATFCPTGEAVVNCPFSKTSSFAVAQAVNLSLATTTTYSSD